MVNNLWERKSKEKHVKQESVDSGDISSNNKDIDREEEGRHRQKKKHIPLQSSLLSKGMATF